MPVELNGHSLEYPVISINAGKNIVETTLTERQGTVKELVSSGDWEITIRGLIIGENGGFPEDEMQEMVDLFHVDKAVEIKSALTDLVLIRSDRKGESSVVIKELTFPEVKGIMNVRPYELKLVSDAPFNLEEVG
jgi:hypothetical protein